MHVVPEHLLFSGLKINGVFTVLLWLRGHCITYKGTAVCLIKLASLLPFGFLPSSFGQDGVSAGRCCSQRVCRDRVSTDYGLSVLPWPLSHVRVKWGEEAAPLIWETPHWPWHVWILACCISTNFLGMKGRDLFIYINLVGFFSRSVWLVLWCYFLLVMNFPWVSKVSPSSWQQDHLCRQVILLIREVSDLRMSQALWLFLVTFCRWPEVTLCSISVLLGSIWDAKDSLLSKLLGFVAFAKSGLTLDLLFHVTACWYRCAQQHNHLLYLCRLCLWASAVILHSVGV